MMPVGQAHGAGHVLLISAATTLAVATALLAIPAVRDLLRADTPTPAH